MCKSSSQTTRFGRQRSTTAPDHDDAVRWTDTIESTPAAPLTQHKQSPREAALLAVYDWVQDWSDCARTVITRRDQLIRLGIGKRRPRKSDAQPTPQPPVAPPVAPVLALPAKTNGVTPGSIAVSVVQGGEHA